MKYLAIILLSVPLLAQVSMKAPSQAGAGEEISISWTGGQDKDFITIVEEGTEEGRYKKYKYARGQALKTVVPEQPGEYEIRYLSAEKPYPTLAMQPLKVTPITASVSVPDSVGAGSFFKVNWTGPNNPRDYITIVPADSPDKTYKKYKYTKTGNPVELRAPDQAGDYEVRYLSGQDTLTWARAPIQVTAVVATVEAPSQADAGAKIQVSWTGPNNRGDYITIVPAGSPEHTYKKYRYTKAGNPVELAVPDEPGDYEVRYLTGLDGLTLGSAPIRIGKVEATLTAKANVPAGGLLEVTWTGPDNQGDYITIVPAGSPEKTYKKYRYTKSGNPVNLLVPETAGQYEIRYLTGQKGLTLGSAPLEVTKVTASLHASARVKGNRIFDVKWTGPDNNGDFIAIAPVGSSPNTWPEYTYTHHGDPAKVKAPKEPGDYELRYLTGREHIILATRAIAVDPPDQLPGRLKVVAQSGDMNQPSGSGIEVILDASGSMLKKMGGKRRIDIAKSVLSELATKKLPAGTPFAMRVFGHKEADSCRTDLEVPLGPLNPSAVNAKINAVQAMNLAKTPIALSLEQVAHDMASVSGKRIVVLITDGEETCGGDPAEAIESLKAAGIDVHVNIVGFAIDDENLKHSFEFWADLGNGGYFDAADGQQLGQSLGKALQTRFTVVDSGGNQIASGIAGDNAVELAPGPYKVTAGSETHDVTITSEETTTLSIDR